MPTPLDIQLLTLFAHDLDTIGMRDWALWRQESGTEFMAPSSHQSNILWPDEDWDSHSLILCHPTGSTSVAENPNPLITVCTIVNDLCDLACEYQNTPVPWVSLPNKMRGVARVRLANTGELRWAVKGTDLAAPGSLPIPNET